MPTNRVVILLSPIFVGVAGWVVQLAARYLPGHPTLDKSQLTAAFLAGALFAAAHVAQWVHGWQKTQTPPTVKVTAQSIVSDADEFASLPPKLEAQA